jgi:DNA replication protein DnaC
MHSLGESLSLIAQRNRIMLNRPVVDLPDEVLIGLPLTAVIETASVAVFDRLTDESLDRRDRNDLLDEQRRLERRLDQARERDRRNVARGYPDTCRCLGTGGWGSKYGAVGEGVDPDAQRWTANVQHLPVELCEEYCTCPTGYALLAEHKAAMENAVAYLAQFERERQFESAWADVGIPQNAQQYRLSDFPDKAVVRQIREWNPPQWLFLHGAPRRGKTTLAACLAQRGMDLHWTVRFRSVPMLLNRLKASMDHEGESVTDVLNPLLDVDLLILDDLGTEMSTRWVLEQLFILLNERLTRQKTTIITSNLDLGAGDLSLGVHLAAGREDPDFREQAMRIVARIREAAAIVHVNGPQLTPEPVASLPWWAE